MNQFLTTESKKILQPENISIDLMEHQKTTVHAMLQLEKDGYIDADQLLFYFNTPKDFRIKTTMGILGDIVGAGKSLMIISLISISQTPINRDVVVDSSPNIFVELLDVYDKPKTNLLIVPDNLLIQWNDFFKLSNLNLITYNSTTTLDEILLFDVILIGANNVEGFNAKFPMIKWARIIIDEADSIKLPKKIDFNCRFLWLVTGTPTGLRHSLRSYLTAKIMGNMKGWIFDYITIKNDPEFVKLSLQLQPPKKIKIQCITPNEIHILKDIIPKNTISMINAGNLNEAIKSLNCNCDTTDNILQVVTKNIQIAIKNKTLELETEKKKVYKGELVEQNQQKKIKHIEHILQRLSSRYDSIKKNIMTMNDEYCPICMDEFTKPTIVSCCQTIFCFQCIVLCAGTTKKCPHCMKLIKKENMNVIKKKDSEEDTISETNEINESFSKQMHKLDALINIITNKKQGKFLVFSNYEDTFEAIKKKLKEEKISYGVLKNATGKLIDDFKNGKISVLMLNAHFFGAGMNLQFASDVVLYHRFTKEMEEQVIGRAQRIGRTEQLTVHYLLHSNENNFIEEENAGAIENNYIAYLEND